MQHAPRFLAFVERLRPEVNHIDALELCLLLGNKDLIIIDVRERTEFEKGHLPTAIHLSKGLLERDIENIVPNVHADIVLYCSGGFRSIVAAYNLKQMGYVNVRSLVGGSTKWVAQNLPWSVIPRS